MKSRFVPILILSALAFVSSSLPLAAQTTDTTDNVITFDKVLPVFKKHCVSCHGIERERGGLNLSSMEGITAGSSSGPVAVSGKPEASMLYMLPAHLESPKMPPGKAKIPQRELELIRSWIEGGMQELKANPAAGKESKPNVVVAKPSMPKGDVRTVRIDWVTPLQRSTAITALAISPKDGTVAVSGSRQIVVFPKGSDQPTGAIPFPEGDVFVLRFTPNGEWLLAGGGTGAESGKVVAFEVATGRRLFEVGDESDVVLAMDITSDRKLIALGGPGRVVKVYRTQSRELLATLHQHTDWILSVAFSPDGLLLASSDRFGGLQVWESETGKPFYSLRGHAGAVNTIAWSQDSEHLLSGGNDGVLRIWEMHGGTTVHQWNSEIGGVLSAAWLTNHRIVAGGRRGKMALFDAKGNREHQWTIGDEVVELAASVDGNSIISGDASGVLSTWDINSDTSTGNLRLPIATSIAATELPPLARKPRSKPVIMSEVADQSDRELQQAREALAANEAAIKTTEETLATLKTSEALLRRVIEAKEATAKSKAASKLQERR